MPLFHYLETLIRKPLFLILATVFLLLAYFRLDLLVAQWFMVIDLNQNFPQLKLFNYLGESLPIFFILFGLGLYFKTIRKKPVWADRFLFLGFCTFVPIFICTLLKISLGRARPVLWFQENLYGFYGFALERDYWSFPSGHTSVVMGLVFGLTIVFPKRALFWGILGLGLMLVSTRVMLLHHYLSDVMAGLLFALIEISILFYFVRKKGWFKNAYEQYDKDSILAKKNSKISDIDSPSFR